MNFSTLAPRLIDLARSTLAVGLIGLAGSALGGDADALYRAAQDGDSAQVSALIDGGADVNARSSTGSYALNAAAVENNIALMQLLLDRGANPNVQNSEGDTPLICATKYGGGKAATVKLLIAVGTDQKHRDLSGKTALDYAEAKDQQEAIVLLKSPGS